VLCKLKRTRVSQTVYMQVEPKTGQTAYMQVEPDTGQTAYTVPSMTVPLPEEDRCVALLSVDHAVARQTEETSIESSLSMLQIEDTVDKLLPEQVYNFCSKPETEIESSEIPDPAQPCCSSCKEEPLAKPDMEIHGEICPLKEENLVRNEIRDNDVPTRQDCKGKVEVDAKAGATRHLPSRSSRRTKNKPTDDGNCVKEAKRRQHDNRPEGNCTCPPDKTCIWIEYHQHRLSALLDTGSDVSIAGEKLARELGWTISAHDTEAVGVANSKTMSILGAARVELIVAGHSVES